MNLSRFRFVLGVVVLAWGALAADEESWTPLFNGRDLSGWVNVNCAPSTWTARDGLIVSTGKPTGVMRTARMYENFVLELEWKHLQQGGNAGLFVFSDAITAPGVPFTKSIEVQIINGNHPEGLWTGHGDIFSIHGATFKPDRPHPQGWQRCLPSERRANPAGQWNHYRVECRDGKVSLAVNGKVVSGGTQCVPRKGYICLESEGSETHFRNLRIRELPSSNPPASEIAQADEGFQSLYTGVDLVGWKQPPGQAGLWKTHDWILDGDGRSEGQKHYLWTEKEYGDFTLIADWRFNRKSGETPESGHSGIWLRGVGRGEVNISSLPIGSGELVGLREDSSLPAQDRAEATPKLKADRRPGEWNRFVITLRGERLTVALNGKTVIENARVPGLPTRGPIGLEHGGDPIQFANLYLKEH